MPPVTCVRTEKGRGRERERERERVVLVHGGFDFCENGKISAALFIPLLVRVQRKDGIKHQNNNRAHNLSLSLSRAPITLFL
jgi:hypothetical protein